MINMKNNKKGISAIVATVLIILITVAAVTIIWAAIIPMIQDQISGSTECFDASAALVVKGDNSCVRATDTPASDATCTGPGLPTTVCDDPTALVVGDCIVDTVFCNFYSPEVFVPYVPADLGTGTEVDVQVHRGTGNFELEGLEIIIGSGGNTESVKFTNGIGDGVPDKNGDHVYTITPSTLTGTINEASVAAIVTSGNAQKTCEKSGIVTISPCL
jgi:flagellin-like protein